MNPPASHVSYQLLLGVAHDVTVRVGALGALRFPPGTYVYTGSALRNLRSRILRHLSRSKSLHWHIDYLLAAPDVRVAAVRTSRTAECAWNTRTPGRIVHADFGASDCAAGCGAHLKYLGNPGRGADSAAATCWSLP